MPPRLHVPVPLASGAALTLPAAAARHVQVLRLQPGAPLVLFNGDDGSEWGATVLRMTKSAVEVVLGTAQAVDREARVAVTLAVGVPANDRMDALVEKACELGAAAIQPLLCARSVLRLAGERAEAKRRHWAGVAAAASEQCGRTRVAEVRSVRSLAEWLASDDASTDEDTAPRGRIVLSLDSAAQPLSSVLASVVNHTTSSLQRPHLIALSGPEGGLSGDEEAAAVACGFVRASLGPRVLRADTAPLAVLAWLAVQADAAA